MGDRGGGTGRSSEGGGGGRGEQEGREPIIMTLSKVAGTPFTDYTYIRHTRQKRRLLTGQGRRYSLCSLRQRPHTNIQHTTK